MAYVFIADDFTGASDTLATLARAGLKARLFRDLPTPDDLVGLEAWGIATPARALDRKSMIALGQRLGKGIADFSPDFLHLKICSTFDSSPGIGNFVLMAQILSDALGIADIAVIGGQPSLGRHAIFGTLFARGPDGRVHRIDRHPVMSIHPVTPMLDADMLRHLEALGLHGLHLVLRGMAGDAFPRYYDALDQSDVEAAGRDLHSGTNRCLVIGASSVAEAWLASRGYTATVSPPHIPINGGPILAFAGSRSSLTTAQIAAAESYNRLPINPADMVAKDSRFAEAQDWAVERLARHENCIIFLTADHAGPISPADLAEASAEFVTQLIEKAQPGALVVAGGDTSSAIIGRLAPAWLDFAGMLCPGVPILRSGGATGELPLALKGGQMGALDFFDQARAILQDGTRCVAS